MRRWLERIAILEGALVGGSAALLVLAASSRSGGAGADVGELVVAAVASVLGFAGTWVARRASSTAAARELDRRLGTDGGILTAFERESAERTSDLDRLLLDRTLARVDVARALGSVCRARSILLALPLASLGAWSIGRELGPSRAPRATTVSVSSAVAEIARIEDVAHRDVRTGKLAPSIASEAAELADRARAIERESERGSRSVAELAGDSRSLRDALRRLAREVPEDGELASALARAAERAAGLAASLGLERSNEHGTGSAADSMSRDADRSGAGRLDRDDSLASDVSDGNQSASIAASDADARAATGFQSRDGDTRVDGSPARDGAALARDEAAREASTRDAPAERAELGIASDRWWPERYDTVVERWIATRRTTTHPR